LEVVERFSDLFYVVTEGDREEWEYCVEEVGGSTAGQEKRC